MRKKSLRKKSLRKKSLRRKSLNKSLRRKSLRKKSLRNNDNGGSFSKDTKDDDDIESLKRHEPVMSLLNLDDDIFKKVWSNETIKQKYLNNVG